MQRVGAARAIDVGPPHGSPHDLPSVAARRLASADLAIVLVDAGAIRQHRADSTGKAAERAELVGKGPTCVSQVLDELEAQQIERTAGVRRTSTRSGPRPTIGTRRRTCGSSRTARGSSG